MYFPSTAIFRKLLKQAVKNGTLVDIGIWTSPNGTCMEVSDLQNFYADERTHEYMVLHIILCVTSMAMAGLCVFILTRPSMTACPFNFLLTALELANFVFAVHYLPISIIRLIYPGVMCTMSFVCFLFYVRIVSVTSLILQGWLSAVVSIWRCIALGLPIKAKYLLTKKTACWSIITVCVASLLVTVIPYFHYNIVYQIRVLTCGDDQNSDDKVGSISVVLPRYWLTGGVADSAVVHQLTIAVMYLLPSTVFLTATCVLLRIICKTSRRGNAVVKTNLILLLILFSNMASFWIRYFGMFQDYLPADKQTAKYEYPWKNVSEDCIIGLGANTFTIVAYYFMSYNFREVVRSLIMKCRSIFGKDGILT